MPGDSKNQLHLNSLKKNAVRQIPVNCADDRHCTTIEIDIAAAMRHVSHRESVRLVCVRNAGSRETDGVEQIRSPWYDTGILFQYVQYPDLVTYLENISVTQCISGLLKFGHRVLEESEAGSRKPEYLLCYFSTLILNSGS